MDISKKLKTARSHLGLNQRDMAEAAGSAYRSWQGYERGQSVPGGKVFEGLAKLGFNTHWFFDDDAPMLLESQAGEAQLDMLNDVLHNDPDAVKRREQKLQSLEGSLPNDDIGLGESVELLAKIYNSGNPVLIRAIAANLHAFSEAVDNKAMTTKTVNMMDEMNKRMTALEKELTEMRAGQDGRGKAAVG